VARSRVRVEINKRKIRKLAPKLSGYLSTADDLSFLQMVWAVDALQSMFKIPVGRYLSAPPEAATNDPLSPYFAHKWNLETLTLLLLALPKQQKLPGGGQIDCSQYRTLMGFVRLLQLVEDSEAGLRLHEETVSLELSRLAHQQFGWQRGFYNGERLYRYIFVYGQGKCAEYFEQTHGLSIHDFIRACIELWATLTRTSLIKPSVRSGRFKLAPGAMEKAVAMVTRTLPELRNETRRLIGELSGTVGRVSYLPSALRRFPIISSAEQGGLLIAPLPQLIIFRASAGLYYDLHGGGPAVLHDANLRFEEYCRKLIRARFPNLEPLETSRYGTRKHSFDTPDVMIRKADRIVAVLECKAAKVTFQAQYAEDPLTHGRQSAAQIVKGITQLWRFFSHVRRGLYDQGRVAADAPAIIVTMDPWGILANELVKACLARAREVLSADREITEADMRPVAFASIEELDDILATTTEEQMLQTLRRAAEPDYVGWSLNGVRNTFNYPNVKRRPYPFRIRDVLPDYD
jgi:hypothetical protein